MKPKRHNTATARSVLRVKAQGSYRSVHGSAWGINFGPESDVDAVIPDSGGLTLRMLKDGAEISADCFEEAIATQMAAASSTTDAEE